MGPVPVGLYTLMTALDESYHDDVCRTLPEGISNVMTDRRL